MDGLEEFITRKAISHKDRVGNNITDVIHNKDLPQCRVLLTSRPGFEHDLPSVYARMSIDGFSPDSFKAYIDNFLENEEERTNLKDHIDNTNLLLDLISTPLFCVMTCHLWQKGQKRDLETESTIFDHVNHFLSNHRKLCLPLDLTGSG